MKLLGGVIFLLAGFAFLVGGLAYGSINGIIGLVFFGGIGLLFLFARRRSRAKLQRAVQRSVAEAFWDAAVDRKNQTEAPRVDPNAVRIDSVDVASPSNDKVQPVASDYDDAAKIVDFGSALFESVVPLTDSAINYVADRYQVNIIVFRRELIYLYYVFVDYLLQTTTIPSKRKNELRDSYITTWTRRAVMYDSDYSEQALDVRLREYMSAIHEAHQARAEGEGLYLGKCFARLCNAETNFSLSLQIAQMYVTAFKALIAFAVKWHLAETPEEH